MTKSVNRETPRGLGIPERALEAWRALQSALEDVVTACQPDPAPWFSVSPAERERASSACMPCPVRVQCDEYATAARERGGVWGGIDRGFLVDHSSDYPVDPGRAA